MEDLSTVSRSFLMVLLLHELEVWPFASRNGPLAPSPSAPWLPRKLPRTPPHCIASLTASGFVGGCGVQDSLLINGRLGCSDTSLSANRVQVATKPGLSPLFPFQPRSTLASSAPRAHPASHTKTDLAAAEPTSQHRRPSRTKQPLPWPTRTRAPPQRSTRHPSRPPRMAASPDGTPLRSSSSSVRRGRS